MRVSDTVLTCSPSVQADELTFDMHAASSPPCSYNEVFRTIPLDKFPAPADGEVLTINSDVSVAQALHTLSKHKVFVASLSASHSCHVRSCNALSLLISSSAHLTRESAGSPPLCATTPSATMPPGSRSTSASSTSTPLFAYLH